MFSNMFWIRGRRLYFNIRHNENVIQASLRGNEFNLHYIFFNGEIKLGIQKGSIWNLIN